MTMSRHGPTVPLHAIEEGRGQPIVLSHALGMDLHSWDALAARLARDYTVLRPDHRGHGASPAPAGPYSMDALVEDTAALLRARGDAPVVWVGLSMGGMVGLGLAIRHPELLRGLVVAHACAHYPDAARAAWNQRIATVAAEGIGAIADAVMGRYFHRKFRAEHPDVEAIARRTLLATPLEGYLGCCHAVRDVDWRAGLESIRMPVLVIAGQLRAFPWPCRKRSPGPCRGRGCRCCRALRTLGRWNSRSASRRWCAPSSALPLQPTRSPEPSAFGAIGDRTSP